MNHLNLAGIGMTSQRTRDRLIQRLQEQGVSDHDVLEVIRSTPRHIFLDEALAHRAYEDTALPIGFQQTLSQPYIVARMTELLLADGPRKKVLEVGTGSGYQTAILSQLCERVFTVERIKALQDKARDRFRLLGLRNIQHKVADGGYGWPEQGPYDGIISTAAPTRIPDELVAQLADGGRLIIPVGDGRKQFLKLITRHGSDIKIVDVESVKFVPLLSGVVR